MVEGEILDAQELDGEEDGVGEVGEESERGLSMPKRPKCVES